MKQQFQYKGKSWVLTANKYRVSVQPSDQHYPFVKSEYINYGEAKVKSFSLNMESLGTSNYDIIQHIPPLIELREMLAPFVGEPMSNLKELVWDYRIDSFALASEEFKEACILWANWYLQDEDSLRKHLKHHDKYTVFDTVKGLGLVGRLEFSHNTYIVESINKSVSSWKEIQSRVMVERMNLTPQVGDMVEYEDSFGEVKTVKRITDSGMVIMDDRKRRSIKNCWVVGRDGINPEPNLPKVLYHEFVVNAINGVA